jgi:hypothetical protein
MKLTNNERLVLDKLCRLRDDPPTIASAALENPSHFVGMTICVGAMLGVSLWRENVGSALLFGGFYLGVLAGDIGRAISVARNWPTWARVLDWQRVDTLLREDRDNDQPPSP